MFLSARQITNILKKVLSQYGKTQFEIIKSSDIHKCS